jgi:hypothetical protein
MSETETVAELKKEKDKLSSIDESKKLANVSALNILLKEQILRLQEELEIPQEKWPYKRYNLY